MSIRSLLAASLLTLPAGLGAQILDHPGNARQILLGVSISCNRCTLAFPEYVFEEPPVISDVTPGSIAARSGLMPGDTVISIEGESITSHAGAAWFAARVPGRSQRWVVGRAERRVTLTVAIPPDA
jgi:S1-C subfamily serine protease